MCIRDSLLHALLDDRLVHLVRRGISSRDHPGVRFDAYVLDFGFYVTRRATRGQPLPLKVADAEGNIVDLRDVPGADYRSVRNAVLDFSLFGLEPEKPLPPPQQVSEEQIDGQLEIAEEQGES